MTWNIAIIVLLPAILVIWIYNRLVRNRNLVSFGGIANTNPQSRLARRDTWLYQPQTQALFRTYGQGCAGAAGIPTLYRPNQAGNHPWIGQTFRIGLRNLPNISTVPAFLMFGGDPDLACPGLPLPLALGILGAPGCALETCSTLSAPITQQAQFLVPIPLDPILIGIALHTQAVALDPTANALGACFSNRGDLTIGAK